MGGRTRTGGQGFDFITDSANCVLRANPPGEAPRDPAQRDRPMTFITRSATLADIRQMAEVAGSPVTAQGLADWMDGDSAYAAWHLIEDDSGRLLGFQHIGRTETLAADACEIATFLDPNPLPVGAAASLFDATAHSARLLRYAWISADVAAENAAARIYYQNRGFRLYSSVKARVLMRFDLD